MYALADCNNFFVSCERIFNPSLNGKPVVVLSNNDGCAIARSNEAKALGIPMGCPAFQLKNYAPQGSVIMLSARHVMYQDISNRIMKLLGEVAINLEIYSVDEAFFKLPYDDNEKNFELLAGVVKKIYKFVGVPVSIGYAPTRTLAKIASHIAKKDPLNHHRVKCLASHDEIAEVLKNTDISDVWGIGRRLNLKLKSSGIYSAWQLAGLSRSYLQKTGNINLVRTARELLGEDSVSINPVTIAHKSIMNSRTFSHVINSRREMCDAIVTFAQSCATRLRQEESAASVVTVYVRGDHFREDLPFYSNSCTLHMQAHTSSAMDISRYALLAFYSIFREGFYYRKAGVMVSEIKSAKDVQLNLFSGTEDVKQSKLMNAIDNINKRYGKRQVALAPTIKRGEWSPKQEHLGNNGRTLRFYSGMNPTATPMIKSATSQEIQEQEDTF